MQALLLALPGFLGAFALACAGFGPALVFMFFWFSYDELGVLDETNALKDAVFMASMVSFTSSSIFFLRTYEDVQPKVAAYMSFFGLLGVLSGIETLRAVGDQKWVKRSIGLVFFIAFLLQFQAPIGEKKHATISLKADLISLALGCYIAAFMGGLIGAYGPPLIVTTLVRNYDKTTFQPNLAAYLCSFSSVQLLYNIFIWKSTESYLRWCYLSVGSSALVGILLGFVVSKYISQNLFRKILQAILFIASLTIMNYAFPWALWVTGASILIVIVSAATLYYTDGDLSVCAPRNNIKFSFNSQASSEEKSQENKDELLIEAIGPIVVDE